MASSLTSWLLASLLMWTYLLYGMTRNGRDDEMKMRAEARGVLPSFAYEASDLRNHQRPTP